MNLIGKMLDNRYEIIEKIGNGGMATVYKAKCHVLNRYVAVKILRDEFTTDSEFIKRFNSEAQSAASLTHPNIVSIFDVGNENNLYYIVMELIQGKTLKEIIIEDGALSWKWSTNIAMQIASALQTAHSNGIIHRDIKPHNIIITEDGVAKVTDFGIAKAVSNSTITAFGSTIGSVHYFSPEHARGGFTDAKSDLYSLGVVMYEMLTAKVPFDADTPVSVALKQVQEEPVEPVKYNKDIPVAINRIILKAMQKDPNARYLSADDMLIDLDEALKNPEGEFVTINVNKIDSPTQRISIVQDEDLNKKSNRTNRENKTKKNSKIKKILNNKFVKILLILLICGIIFIGVMFATIGIINASRPKQANIPNLLVNAEKESLTKEEAIKLLEEAGFTNYEVKEEFDDNVELNHVIKQTPNYQENYLYNLSEKITITVSKGSKMIILPKKIKGENKEDVIAALDELEAKYTIVEENNEEVEKDIIFECDQEAGTEISASTMINLKVSLGSQYKDLTVTSVVGKTEAEAKKALEDEGFTVVVVEYGENTSKSDGIVLAQSVTPGKTIKENETITLTVNKIPEKHSLTINFNVPKYEENNSDSENEVTSSPIKPTYTVSVKVGDDKNTFELTYSDKAQTIAKEFNVKFSKVQEIKVYDKNGNTMDTFTKDFSTGNQSITVNVPEYK